LTSFGGDARVIGERARDVHRHAINRIVIAPIASGVEILVAIEIRRRERSPWLARSACYMRVSNSEVRDVRWIDPKQRR
jgi:hypothetical protein